MMSETSEQTIAPSVRYGFMKFVVGDLAKMVDFYGRAFGLVVAQTIDTDTMTEKILRRAGEQTGFSLILYFHKDGRNLQVGTGYGPLGLFVRDVDAAYAHAVAQGATADRAPMETNGMRVAFVLDPEGRELELISMVRN